MLSIKEIKELIDLVSEKGLGSLEIERAGFRLKIEGLRRESSSNGAGGNLYLSAALEAARLAAPLSATAESGGRSSLPEAPAAPAEEPGHVIVSPIVGTFYRAASPEAPAFVSPGDLVEKGKILCIIEAMKLMNEIESDVSGVVLKVFPQNGQPVEYGEKMFLIQPS
jgi:acetyl-CoA carboxylase biotin carboxyl carrier protein